MNKKILHLRLRQDTNKSTMYYEFNIYTPLF